jgi:BirA family biotin operon repressor/biotin-[acetyl-CoA-carboxylase] ligase
MTKNLLNWIDRYNLIMFDEIDSTNLEARRLIESGIDNDFVIVSSKQTNGRGRRGKEWVSDEGNLYLSLILRPYGKPYTFCQLSFITAIALYDAITALSREYQKPIDLKLKWPNDILVNGAKISGILLEYIEYAEKEYIVIGLGVNVQNAPKNLNQNTSSIAEIFGDMIDVNDILGIFMSNFHKYYRRWQMDGFAQLRRLWLSRAHRIGEIITISNDNLRISGAFKDINNQGAIRLKLASGQISIIHEGSIEK